jgi:uncharacterized lipoprotein YddW (UPF0748 family)
MLLESGSGSKGSGRQLDASPFAVDPAILQDGSIESTRQLDRLRHETKEALKSAKKAHLPFSLDAVRDDLKRGDEALRAFGHWLKRGDHKDEQALSFNVARDAYADAQKSILTAPAETRACWFDRKTIVTAGPGELAREIQALADAGINTIYFECDNGGYALYNSSLQPRNPDLAKWEKWDPLREAIDAAHARGMKVEAWTKVFLACNRALEAQLARRHPDQSFPQSGPILSRHNSNAKDPFGDWALRLPGSRLPQDGNDLFLDPANPEARQFAQNKMLELAGRYPDLDGIQYDYIRYPFHHEDMGLNDNNWKSFQNEYPRYKSSARPQDSAHMDPGSLRDWNEWKSGQIDSFVQDTSKRLLELNPQLDISAAVYPCDLNGAVRQNWERWAINGWIKTLNPMTYVPHDPAVKDAEFSREYEAKFKSDIKDIVKAASGKVNVLPGIEVERVNPDGVLKEIEIVRRSGVTGESLFAASVLSEKRLEGLEVTDARDDYSRFSAMIHACWSGGDERTRPAHARILQDSDRAGKSLKGLSNTGSADEIKPVLVEIAALCDEIKLWLSQNPEEKTVWTDEFLMSLKSTQDSLTAAAQPTHFAAWDMSARQRQAFLPEHAPSAARDLRCSSRVPCGAHWRPAGL